LVLLAAALAGSSPLFFFPAPSTTVFYTLSLHDALPILASISALRRFGLSNNVTISSEFTFLDSNNSVIDFKVVPVSKISSIIKRDRKSTRLNSSHVSISYAVFCLTKKKYIRYCYYLYCY